MKTIRTQVLTKNIGPADTTLKKSPNANTSSRARYRHRGLWGIASR